MNEITSSEDRAKAWSQYWSSGRLSSCPGYADSNYSGVIAESWEKFFTSLPDHCKLLDIACGNGALLAIAQRHTKTCSKSWQMTGVDKAQVEQTTKLKHHSISLYGEIDMHALPFASSSFAVVCSQYGIEYGHFPDNMIEALRVLKPQGQFQFLLHCADSVIARRAVLQLQQIELLQCEWKLFELLQIILQVEADAQKLLSAKNDFDSAAAMAFAYMKAHSPEQDVSLIEQSLQQLGSIWQVRGQQRTADSIQACKDAEQALMCLRQRLLDQQAAMLDQQQAEVWLEQSTELAAEAQLSRIDDAGVHVGWCLAGIK